MATTQWVKAEIEAKIVEYDGEVISENEIRNLPQLNALWHRGIMGVESCILDYGEKLAPMIISGDNQHIRILNGVGMMQGRFFRVKDYDTIAIPNGAQNYNRIDIVCAKITQNENGTQSFSWEVVQGTQTTGTPQPPTVAEGSLDDGDAFALMPIASVKLEGVNIVAVETVASISTAGEHISLDTDATEGTDKELTDTLTSLGWLSEVFSGGKLLLKKLLKNVIVRLSGIGTYYYATSPNKSVGATTTNLCSLTLPKGTYIIRGAFKTGLSTTVMRIARLAPNPAPIHEPMASIRWYGANGGGDFSIVLYKFDVETTVTFSGYCASTIALEGISMEAIKIG